MNRLPEESSLHTEVAGSASPDAFGPFRVLHQVGAGTLGPVFRAYEPERDRLVAIKLFRLDLPPERVHQLVGEFEQLIAAGLDHPVIAAPLAAGIEGVTAYLAQDYVTADSLDIVIREGGPASVSDAVGVATRLAEALDFAADNHIVHGALHPRDVLLSSDDFRVTGLGVARALERVAVVPPVRRPYTAPERVGGGAWDRRADVFSLAAVMHELIWGRRLAGTGAQAAAGISETGGGDLLALRDVFVRALAEDMADRFPTATEFANALTAAFENRPQKVSRLVRRAPRSSEPRLPLENRDAEDGSPITSEPVRYQEIEAGEPDQPRTPPKNDVIDVADIIGARSEPLEPPEPLEPLALVEPVEPLESPTPVEMRPGSLLSPGPASEPSSLSLVWPLVLAGVVGAALGFGAGYTVAIRDRPASRAVVNDAAVTDGGSNPTSPATSATVPPPSGEVVGRELPPIGSSDSIAPARVPAPARPVPAPAPRASAPVAPLFAGRVLVRSTPPGARVFVDGHGGGETPTTVRDLARGTHQVRLVRDGYTTVERRVVITAAEPSQTLTVAMAKTPPPAPPKTEAPLIIESKPSGAAVFLDGRQVGTTPLTFPLVQIGTHSVRITLDGYRPWTSPVQVSATETNRVTASLER
jgi:serine/threonine-protein kinase